MTLIRVTREEEAIGICAGAYLGGRNQAVTHPAHYDLIGKAHRQAQLARVPVLLLFDRLALLGDAPGGPS